MLGKQHETRCVLIQTCHDMDTLVGIIIADKVMFDKVSHGIIMVNTWNTSIAIGFINHQEVIILIDYIQVKGIGFKVSCGASSGISMATTSPSWTG